MGALFCFRTAPFVGFVVFGKGVAAGTKLVALAAFLALLWACIRAAPHSRDALLALPLVYAYLGGLALALPSVTHAVRHGWIARLPLAVGLLMVYIILPGGFAPPEALLPALILGWDSWFKAYSYSVDAAWDDETTEHPYGEALFFMLVSPTLVWAERGQASSEPRSLQGLLRCLLAWGTWSLEDLLRWLSSVALTQGLPAPFSGMLRGVAYYLGHSALASLQIGWMSILGYTVRERYEYPLLASSPVEFWRRWNTWLGSWARRYAFVPVSTRMRRSFRALPASAVQGLAVLVTFALVGSMHDVIRGARYFRHGGSLAVSFDATWMFIGFGLIVAVWVRAAGSLCKLSSELAVPALIVKALPWALFLPCMAVMYRTAESVLAGRGLPLP